MCMRMPSAPTPAIRSEGIQESDVTDRSIFMSDLRSGALARRDHRRPAGEAATAS
jgi:hypothetical protein